MTGFALTMNLAFAWLALQAGGGSIAAERPLVSALLWSIPWGLAIRCTRNRRWCADRWLDLALKFQTATACVVFAAQIAGMLGLLRWVLPWAPPLIYGLTIWHFARFRSNPPAPPNAFWPTFTILPALAVGCVIVTFFRLFPVSLLGAVKVVSDAPIYHLYFAAKWWLAGAIEWIPIPFGESAAPYFPANGDLIFTYLVGWTGDLTLAGIGQVPFWFFAGWLIVCLCRSLGASTGSGIISAALWMTITPLAQFTFEANVDTIFAAWFLASVLFYLEYDMQAKDEASQPACASEIRSSSPGKLENRTATTSCGRVLFVQSLIAAGLAWGTKAPGLVFVPPWIVLVTIREITRSGRISPARTAKSTACIWLISILPVAFWYGRNLLATGNPLYPLPIEIGGRTLADGWYGPEVMRQSPYYIPFTQWRAAVDQLLAVTDPRILPVAVIALIWWIPRFFRTGDVRKGWVGVLAMAGIVTIAQFWCLIPYRTQQRFFLHGLTLFAPVMALCMDRFRVYKSLCAFVLCLHVFTTQGWPMASSGQQTPWDLTPKVPNAMPGIYPFGELVARFMTADLQTFGLTLSIAGLFIAWAWRDTARRIVMCMAWLVAIAGFAMVLAGVQLQLDRIGRGQRFPIFPDYERAWNAFDAITKSNPRKVAYSGTNLAIYLMGPRFANSVEYVNVNDRADFMPHDYHLAQVPASRRWSDPRPTWERLQVDYDAWRKNLLDKGIELVVVARANPDEGRANPHDWQGFPIERTWMDSHPNQFRPVYGLRENDPEMRIYEVLPKGFR